MGRKPSQTCFALRLVLNWGCMQNTLRMSRAKNSDVPAPLSPPESNSLRVLWRCAGYLRPYWRMTLGAYLALVGINALALTIPQFIRWIVDHGIGEKNIPLLLSSVAALLGLRQRASFEGEAAMALQFAAERAVATQFNAAHAYQRQIVPTRVWVPFYDPLILDLDGDGIETRGLDPDRPVFFDHNGDGVRTHTGWVAPDDGFLVLDRNGNGLIDDGTELFGDSTPLPDGSRAINGFHALAHEDTNNDGRVDAADLRFADLRVQYAAAPTRAAQQAPSRDGIAGRLFAPPISNGKLIAIHVPLTIAANAPSWPMAA